MQDLAFHEDFNILVVIQHMLFKIFELFVNRVGPKVSLAIIIKGLLK